MLNPRVDYINQFRNHKYGKFVYYYEIGRWLEGDLSWDDRRPRNRGVFVVWPNDTESYQCDREWWREFEVSRSWDLSVHENCSPFLSTGFLSSGMPANMGRMSGSLLLKSCFTETRKKSESSLHVDVRMTIVFFLLGTTRYKFVVE